MLELATVLPTVSVGRFSNIVLIITLLFGFGFCPPAARLGWAEEGLSLEQWILAIESIDRELAGAKKQLKEEKSALNRRKLQVHIDELQQKQERSLQELEQRIGPLPPAVRSERPIPLEQMIKAQERRHEKSLESDVERRLPR